MTTERCVLAYISLIECISAIIISMYDDVVTE